MFSTSHIYVKFAWICTVRNIVVEVSPLWSLHKRMKTGIFFNLKNAILRMRIPLTWRIIASNTSHTDPYKVMYVCRWKSRCKSRAGRTIIKPIFGPFCVLVVVYLLFFVGIFTEFRLLRTLSALALLSETA